MKYFDKKFFEVYKPSFLIFILVGVIIDLVSKYWVVQNYAYHQSECYMDQFFCMTLTFNTGFVFGFFQNNAIISLFSTGVAIIFIIFYRWKNEEMSNPWGWNFVMIGAFGNFIDKFFIKIPKGGGIKFGFTPTEICYDYPSPANLCHRMGVVDFLDFEWPDFLLFERWPAFNFADSCVSVGLVILIFSMYQYEKKMLAQNSEQSNQK